MTDRAHVERDHARLGVAIYLAHDFGPDRRALGEPTDVVFRTLTDGEAAAQQEPTLRLPESMARALLDALAAHFGETGDVQTLRADYLAERSRVDKMIAYLTTPPLPVAPE